MEKENTGEERKDQVFSLLRDPKCPLASALSRAPEPQQKKAWQRQGLPKGTSSPPRIHRDTWDSEKREKSYMSLVRNYPHASSDSC